MAINATNETDMASFLWYRYPSRTAILEEFAPVGPSIERIVPPFWYFIGFLGNPICIVIWLGQRMRRNNSSAVYLGALSISDMVFLLLHLLYILHVAWGYDVYNHPIACEVFHFLFYVPQYMSTFLVLGFTFERYVAVCHPFLKERWCTVRRAVAIVCLLLLTSIGLSSAQVYIWTYHEQERTCNIRADAGAGNDRSFWNIWTWITDISAFGLVPLVVLIFNVLVLREIFKISKNDVLKRQQHQGGGSSNNTASTVTLLSVSFYFIVTQLSATIMVCLQQAFPTGKMQMSDEEIRNDPTWSSLFLYLEVRKVIEIICLSHYACYFFIYCITGKHFRKEVMFMITFHGKLPFLSRLSEKRRRERYSLVSSNGGPMSETYATSVSTTM